MKIKKINILLAVSFGAIIAFSACKKDDGAIPERVSIIDVPAITTTIDPTGSQFITFSNQAAFSGKFKVDLYFPGATPPDKVDIVVRKTNGTTINNNNVKLYRADVTSLPASFTVTAADIVGLFGTPIALNDNYDFAPDIYVGINKFEAFPPIGTGTGAGVIAMPLFKEYARFKAQ
jgi:hypothetical protein